MKIRFLKNGQVSDIPDHKLRPGMVEKWVKQGLAEVLEDSADLSKIKLKDLKKYAVDSGLDCSDAVKKCRTKKAAIALIDEELGIHA